jgi:hypothetical protein
MVKTHGPGPRRVDGAAAQTFMRWHVTGAWCVERYGDLELTGGGWGGRGQKGGANEGLTRARLVVVKRRGGEEERRWLKLGASAEGSRRELRNEGKRRGGDRGWSSPFIGAG